MSVRTTRDHKLMSRWCPNFDFEGEPANFAQKKPDFCATQLPWRGGSKVVTMRLMIYMARKLVEIRHEMETIQAVQITGLDREQLSAEEKDKLIKSLRNISKESSVLGLRMTILTADRFIDSIQTATRQKVLSVLLDLLNRFWDEVGLIKFIYIPAEKMAFYDQPEAFGTAVAKAFPGADYDIREAGNCFALGLHTAAVMHSMRVLESGLNALGHGLRATRSIQGWGNDLKIFQDKWGTILATKPKKLG